MQSKHPRVNTHHWCFTSVICRFLMNITMRKIRTVARKDALGLPQPPFALQALFAAVDQWNPELLKKFHKERSEKQDPHFLFWLSSIFCLYGKMELFRPTTNMLTLPNTTNLQTYRTNFLTRSMEQRSQTFHSKSDVFRCKWQPIQNHTISPHLRWSPRSQVLYLCEPLLVHVSTWQLQLLPSSSLLFILQLKSFAWLFWADQRVCLPPCTQERDIGISLQKNSRRDGLCFCGCKTIGFLFR